MNGLILILFWFPRTEAFKDADPDCENGFHGLKCQHKCYFPTYGKKCGNICECEEKYCHYEKGCQLPAGCPAGFTGEYCDVPCTFPRYGLACQQYCLCSKSQCNFITGCQTKNDMKVDKMSSLKTTQTPTNATVRLSATLFSSMGAVLELRSQNPVQRGTPIIKRISTFSGSNWSTDAIFVDDMVKALSKCSNRRKKGCFE